jgi:hypothetical protein
MMAVAWRFALQSLGSGQTHCVAPLSHMLISGFLLSQGFLICSVFLPGFSPV